MDAASRIAALEGLVAERDRRIVELEARVERLLRQVAELTAKLSQHSGNSHKPPSSDGPGGRQTPDSQQNKGSKGTGRKRGAQPGHKGRHRALLPLERVDKVVDLFPDACRHCHRELGHVADPDASRHQSVEIPPHRAEVTEYRQHKVTCRCGHVTQADPVALPSSPFGPRLTALVGLMSGVYHMGRRRVQVFLNEVFDVSMSLGTVSALEGRLAAALEQPHAQVCAAVDAAPVKHTDATSWLEAGKLRSLWVFGTDGATLFRIVEDGTAQKISPLFGACRGILVSDRATVFSFWDPTRRQICWAHLLRKFVSFSERHGLAGKLGKDLLVHGGLLFDYHRAWRAGSVSREEYLRWMQAIRDEVQTHLERLTAADINGVSGSCRDILAHKEALWTFVGRTDVEPTNNRAERDLRGFVMWRKRCFGAQSARGHLFAERVMTVAHTLRRSGRDVFAYLVAAYEAFLAKAAPPVLLAAPESS